jgi:hypothetical protein
LPDAPPRDKAYLHRRHLELSGEDMQEWARDTFETIIVGMQVNIVSLLNSAY